MSQQQYGVTARNTRCPNKLKAVDVLRAVSCSELEEGLRRAAGDSKDVELGTRRMFAAIIIKYRNWLV